MTSCIPSPAAAAMALLCWLVVVLHTLQTSAATLQWDHTLLQLPALTQDFRGRPPSFPSAFQVAYKFTLPYEESVQSKGLTYDVKVWRDSTTGRYRMDTYGGSNVLITTKDANIEVVPRLDKLVCMAYEPDEASNLLQAPVLPDVKGWEYKGSYEVNGQAAELWELEQRHGGKLTIYKFYVTSKGAPVRLHMHGNDLFSGAHFDKYIADYTAYTPGIQDNGVFDKPAICSAAMLQKPQQGWPFTMRMASLLPFFHYGKDEEYDAFVAQHGQQHVSQADYDARRQLYLASKAFVDGANAREPGYTLELNRFSDWTQEEFEAVMLPRHGRRQGLRAVGRHSAELPYQPRVPADRVPRAVDWRGTGADALVKDQAVCGSCWAFSTTGTLQAAHFLATGKTSSFSEQQLMDCSWGHGLNHACDGGDQDEAIQYIVEAGGIAPEASYTYRGQDSFCRDKNLSDGELVQFKGFVYVPEYNDEALMEAIYSRGPVAVSLDASQPGFRFYSEGVYNAPNCMYKPEDLDHAVLVVGYGTTEGGRPYWLVRNSWSKYWGNRGYIKIARDGPGQACGITSGPLYAVTDSASQ